MPDSSDSIENRLMGEVHELHAVFHNDKESLLFLIACRLERIAVSLSNIDRTVRRMEEN